MPLKTSFPKLESIAARYILDFRAIAEMCPSDERVLLLIEKWCDCEEKFKDCLKLAFMFLDYPSNGNNSKAWKILSDLLCRIKSSFY
ncbi:UNVERIFIED_CONTAM: hypothetical protein NCL1_17369 [Trichonephila clavipes]